MSERTKIKTNVYTVSHVYRERNKSLDYNVRFNGDARLFLYNIFYNILL